MNRTKTINTRALILAAGKGARMKSSRSKALHTILGKTLIEYVVEALEQVAVERIGVVVSAQNMRPVQAVLKNRVDYIVQREQLGTGHAVLSASDWLHTFEGSLLVLVGDAPFISPGILGQLIKAQQQDSNAAGFLTVKMNPPPPWGRVVRDSDGQALRIVEEKDASDKERNITEVSSSHYCFYWDCLYRALHFVTAANAQKEYYLPDVIEIMVNNGETVTTVPCEDELLAFGINTPSDLRFAEAEMKKRIVNG